jgi:hypothetical protein
LIVGVTSCALTQEQFPVIEFAAEDTTAKHDFVKRMKSADVNSMIQKIDKVLNDARQLTTDEVIPKFPFDAAGAAGAASDIPGKNRRNWESLLGNDVYCSNNKHKVAMTWEGAIADGYEVPSDQQSYTGRKVIIQHDNRFCVYENVNDNHTYRHVVKELDKAISWAEAHPREIGEQISHVEQKKIIETRKNDQSIGIKRRKNESASKKSKKRADDDAETRAGTTVPPSTISSTPGRLLVAAVLVGLRSIS